ncbi:MAG TPA: SHOCT domain-containing protein [Candidatus Limnocylindrales bacterium]|nr:SHOCT domain-containing protein [Candidatus Limnocylindrales bacterium]
MSTVTQNLLNNETVVFEAKKHWLAPLRDSLLAIGLILAALVVSAILPSGDGILSILWAILGIARWVALVVGIAWIVYNIIVWRTAEFAVTSLRVLRYEGLVSRRSSETLLSAVSDVKLSVGFLGKSLGYGDLRIFTQSGDAGADDFSTITGAGEFRNAMMNIKIAEQTGQRFAPAPSPAPPAPVYAAPVAAAPAPVAPAHASADDQAARLVKLAELRDQGVISPEEFEAKKTEILSRM